MKFRHLLLFCFFVLKFFNAQTEWTLDSKWKMEAANQIKESGEIISRLDYDTSAWLPAKVPGTVLSNLVEQNKLPDPFYGMNNEQIPDIYEAGNDFYTYWYVTEFNTRVNGNEQLWLTFRGINYNAEIFLNGKRLNEEDFKGMFLRNTFNITKFLAESGKNKLAVLVHPLPFPGKSGVGQAGDGTIAKNVAHQYPAGWDWIQPIRDRNTGIWDKIFLSKTKEVRIYEPYVVTLVPGERKSGKPQAPAIIKASTMLENTDSKPVKGSLIFEIDGKQISKKVVLEPFSKKEVFLDDLTFGNPELWWPNGYGAQKLYNVRFSFQSQNFGISDEYEFKTGIRQIDTRWNDRTRSMEVWVNGQKIFIKGGNWIISDAMLRFSEERYDAEVRFHRDMNLNLIRIWGGAITERPEFYAAADKYGMLILQDFWFSGDANGRWLDPSKKDDQWTRRKYPDDHQLWLKSAADMIKMIRNHPSLALWCGGNETTPPEDILTALRDKILPSLDPHRTFIDFSTSDQMSYNVIGGIGDGPYGIQEEKTFWDHKTFPFNSEVGSVGIGDAVSLKRFLPKENWIVPEGKMGTEPLTDPVWKYHKYIGYGKHIQPYGGADNMEEFSHIAQLINYNQYRSLIEGFSAHAWDWYTGVIIWKTQNPWTAMRGQMYDYYLDPNAGLFGLRNGSKPLHVMMHPETKEIMLVNNTFERRHNLMIQAMVYDMNGKETLLEQTFSYIENSSVKKILSLEKKLKPFQEKEGAFVLLRLLDEDQHILDENLYWLKDEKGMYSGLQNMKSAGLEVAIEKAGETEVSVLLKNVTANPVAFFNRISLIDGKTGERLLPAFYSDNYFSVMPGNEKYVTISYPKGIKKGDKIEVYGWNVPKVEVTLP